MNPLQRLPEGCTQLTALTHLYLNDVFLEYLPANFGRMSRLRILELRENSLTSLPKSMARLVNLVRLDLGQNQFSEVGNGFVHTSEQMGRGRDLKSFDNDLFELSDILINLNNILFYSPILTPNIDEFHHTLTEVTMPMV